jgi:hypothetical protein
LILKILEQNENDVFICYLHRDASNDVIVSWMHVSPNSGIYGLLYFESHLFHPKDIRSVGALCIENHARNILQGKRIKLQNIRVIIPTS